jgi:60 kDa SS-A/Ro ribonucleoprotein
MAKTSNAVKMYTNVLSNELNPTKTPQSKVIPGREADMAKNNAGGVSFTLDQWGYLDRFLIMGTEGGSYYTGERKYTLDAAKNVIKCITTDGIRTVNRIVEISDQGRAIKNDAAIFALALAAASEDREVAKFAFANLGKVCRIGTHLFSFMEAYNSFGKWRGYAKEGVANWYNRSAEKLAVQLLKYQQRNGWSHRDVLRLVHAKAQNPVQNALFHWTVNEKKHLDGVELPGIVYAVEELHKNATVGNAVNAIQNFGITWEMIPTQLLREKEVWEALIPVMGMTALIRNLGRISSIGVGGAMSLAEKTIISRLTDSETLRNARIHPITVLSALKTYQQGAGDKGSLTWRASPKIIDALNDSFYAAFGNIQPSGENYFLGIDCSGSMFGARVNGINNLTAAEAAAVMALATAKVESNYFIGGFDTSLSELKITPKMRLDQALDVMRRFNWGGTDCAQPMLYAIKNKMNIDKFCVYTDNETWAGNIHPSQALAMYRKTYGKGKLIVAGTSVTNFTIADPKDAGMLDIVGFDSSAPQLISQF